jgi:hypothetical protein
MSETYDDAEAMYRFLELRAEGYMTPKVEAITRQTTMRQLQVFVRAA